MPALQNFIAVDWRAGKDRIYFFFKDSNTYSRFDIGDNEVPAGYPRPINGNWDTFDVTGKDLRFGLTTTNNQKDHSASGDLDILWLFYYENNTPMVCQYNQDTDKVVTYKRVQDSEWASLMPYFDRIVSGTWWDISYTDGQKRYRFILNDGNSLLLYWDKGGQKFDKGVGAYFTHRARYVVKVQPILSDHSYRDPEEEDYDFAPTIKSAWKGLGGYAHRIIAAAQSDRTLADDYLYIFLTHNQYITYNIPKDRVEYGPYTVSEDTWPGLLRN